MVPKKLVYPPTEDNAKSQKKEAEIVKTQVKSEMKAIKCEIKKQMTKKKGLFYNERNQKKKEI